MPRSSKIMVSKEEIGTKETNGNENEAGREGYGMEFFARGGGGLQAPRQMRKKIEKTGIDRGGMQSIK